jgi:hypothetical protein
MVRVATTLLILLFVCAAPVSAQTARLLVTVVDRTTGVSIPDVRVQIFREDPPLDPRNPTPVKTLIASAQTDGLGTAVISVTTFYHYLLRATHKQYVPTEPEFLSIWNAKGEVEMEISLFPIASLVEVPVGEPTEIVQGRLVGRCLLQRVRGWRIF